MTTSTNFDSSIFDKIPSITPPPAPESKYELAPAGTFLGRCFSIIDLWTQEDNYKWELKHNRKISIKFELPTKKDSQGNVFTIYVDHNFFLWEKTNLMKFLVAWRGRAFTQDELDDFHIYKEFLNKPCQITVEHKVSATGNTYAKISSISPVMEGIECPDRINEISWLNLEYFNRDSYESLNDKLKEIIAKSPEYKATAF